MADRPIIFSAPMIRALLDGRKTQTRRQVHKLFRSDYDLTIAKDRRGRNCYAGTNPYGVHWIHDDAPFFPYAPGDRLYVREAWAPLSALTHNDPGPTALAANGFYRADESTVDGEISRWRPSIHMPRWASRLTLHVTDVRVQRLQDISEEDARAEGIEPLKSGRGYYDPTMSHGAVRAGHYFTYAKTAFETLWNSIHGPDAWDANPWVAAITFDVKRGNIDTPTGGTNDRD